MPALPILDFRRTLARQPAALAKGPIAIILVEDDAVVARTVSHHLQRGFRHVILLSDQPQDLAEELAPLVTQLAYDTRPGAPTRMSRRSIRSSRRFPRGPGSITASTPSSCSIPSAKPAPWAKC